LKMNPNKCAFGVSVGEFLGFLVVTPWNFQFQVVNIENN
jgi:hypothetical protein